MGALPYGFGSIDKRRSSVLSSATLSLLTALPRPGRRATSVLVGLYSLLVLVDAAAHPRHFDGLWTLSAASHVTGWFEG